MEALDYLGQPIEALDYLGQPIEALDYLGHPIEYVIFLYTCKMYPVKDLADFYIN